VNKMGARGVRSHSHGQRSWQHESCVLEHCHGELSTSLLLDYLMQFTNSPSVINTCDSLAFL